MIDHLVFAGPDLAAATAAAESVLRVESVAGGQHEGLGTANRLIGLGRSTYLEIVGPDPDQAAPASPRPFGIDSLDGARLVAWAVSTSEINAARLAMQPTEIGVPSEMSRRTPDGQLLRWRLTPPVAGPVPFLIDWLDTPHPASGLHHEATLVDLRVEVAEPSEVRRVIKKLEVEASVRKTWEFRLAATIDLADRRVVLW